jgi:hypothetical protein
MSANDPHPAGRKALVLSRTTVLQLLMVAVAGTIGFFRPPRDVPPSYESFLLMIALPIAAAIIAGSLSREAIEKSKPSFSIALTLPLIHAACIVGLASLVRSRYTEIEVPTDIHPAVIWVEWRMLASIFAAEIPCVALVLVALRLRRRKHE